MGNYNAIIDAIKEESPEFIFPEEEFGVSMVGFLLIISLPTGRPWLHGGHNNKNIRRC